MTETAPKPFVFVLMPFSADFHDVYQLGIKAAAETSGTYCERVDEQNFDGTILQRIYNQISTADIVVADMSGRNPNVFYEVGYAHALDKKVILLTRDPEDIPFDLKHYPHIIYTSVTSLRDELAKRLRWIVENPEKTSNYFSLPLRLFSNGFLLPRIMAYVLERSPGGSIRRGKLKLEVDVYNSPDQSLSTVTFMFGLILPKRFEYVVFYSGFNESFRTQHFAQDGGTIFHLIRQEFTLLPGAWEKLCFVMELPPTDQIAIGEDINLTIRLLTQSGVNDHQLTLKPE
ncbi:MAG: nucleoside 2-deoxyribosyltransferase [Schlesneria sp.]